MHLLKSVFWNKSERRIRSFWRIILYLAIVALIVNPIILLLDRYHEQVLTQTTINFIVAFGFLGGLMVFNRYIDRGSLEHYGILINAGSLNKLISGTVLGILATSAVVLILLLTSQVSIRQTLLISDELQVGFALGLLGQCLRYVFGSIFEEIMSRAFMIRHFAEGIRMPGKIDQAQAIWGGCLSTSILFGALHLVNPGATAVSTLNLSLLGLLFALSYVFTGNLALPIGLHLGWNICQNNIFGFGKQWETLRGVYAFLQPKGRRSLDRWLFWA